MSTPTSAPSSAPLSASEALRRTEWGHRVTAALGALAAGLLGFEGLKEGNLALIGGGVCFACFWWAMVTTANQAEAKRAALPPTGE